MFLSNPKQPGRDPLNMDPADVQSLRDAGVLVTDDRRRRPRYFDGRFLTAKDLTRDQNYFLVRQADLGRAGGVGVVQGLEVTEFGAGGGWSVQPGHGITPSGESVVLPEPLTIDLNDLPQIQRLDAAFGLLKAPNEPARNRSGLFVLALRPVEFSANPVAAYPTTITGERSVQDGDVIEGVVATLLPYSDPSGGGDVDHSRAVAARDIFVQGSSGGIPIDALPLAMLALNRNRIEWLDEFMVRLEVGADHGDVLSFGPAKRARREAFLMQYDQHLQEVLARRDTSRRGLRFAANEHFQALPAAGRLPAQAVDPKALTQSFFPPEIEVDLSIIPEDELPALIEESLLLPPIDLTLPGSALESTSVMLLLPLPIERVRTLREFLRPPAPLPGRLALPPLTRRLRPAATGLLAARRPVEVLRSLRRFPLSAPVPTPPPVVDAWVKEFDQASRRQQGLLWYVRRRNVDYRSDVVGQPVHLSGDDEALDSRVEDVARAAGVLSRVRSLLGDATSVARPLVASLLSFDAEAVTGLAETEGRDQSARLIARAVVEELEHALGASGPPPQKLSASLVRPVSERFSSRGFGAGIGRLFTSDQTTWDSQSFVDKVAASRRVPEIDEATRSLVDDPAVWAQLSAKLASTDLTFEGIGEALGLQEDIT